MAVMSPPIHEYKGWMDKPDCCHRCGGYVGMARTIQANGASRIYWRCKVCKENVDTYGRTLRHKFVKDYLSKWGLSIDDIPVTQDNRRDEYPCVICGSASTEFHHVFPKHLIEQAYSSGDISKETMWKWYATGIHLCRKHHHQWHKWVTPNLIPGLAPERDTA